MDVALFLALDPLLGANYGKKVAWASGGVSFADGRVVAA
jgi:hypothetical protein